jgi:hypothetical protein
MGDISLLLGSGFSIPYGYLSTSELNEKLGVINAEEILIAPSGSAYFLNGQEEPDNWWMRPKERQFIQEFLNFYNTQILSDGHPFNYEEFYDYYKNMLITENYSKKFIEFMNSFIEVNDYPNTFHQILFQFNNSYNQLLSQLLTKNIERSHLCNHPSHNAFLNLIEHFSIENTIHIHSLNHDLYMEHLAYSDSIHAELDDGFEELGSPFYGELFDKYERYKTRLEHFTNNYERKFRLYKLHGSINHFWFKIGGNAEMIKIKNGVGKTELFKEIEKDGKLEYYHDTSNYYPDFLSGKLTKIDQYNRGTYYPMMFNYFKENLLKSNLLIIIGYGFGDEQINKYVQEYAFYEDKKIFVIDIKKPDTDFLERKNSHFIDGGVIGMDIKQIIDNG